MDPWKIDPVFSSVTFSIPNLGDATVKGRFSEWDGRMELEEDGSPSPTIWMSIAAASLTTGDPALDAEATSPRFLDAGRHPRIEFRGSEVLDRTEDGAVLRGDLTVRGVTAPIEVTATLEGRARDLDGTERMSYEVSARVSRSAFGLLWHPALENVAGFVIGDIVQITADVEFVRDE